MRSRALPFASAVWLPILGVGFVAAGLHLAEQGTGSWGFRLLWFVCVVPLSVGLLSACRAWSPVLGARRPLPHMICLLFALILPALLFGLQLARRHAGMSVNPTGVPPGLGSPGGETTVMVLYMALFWSLTLFAAAVLLDIFAAREPGSTESLDT